MSKITSALPSNRVAALATFITGLAGLGTSLAGVWPNPTTNEISTVAGGVATMAGPLAHIVGSWLWDRGQVQVQLKQAELELEKLYREQVHATSTIDGSDLVTEENSFLDTELPSIADSPWWKGHPDIDPQSADPLSAEEFVNPSKDDTGSLPMDDLTSSELGGPPSMDYAPVSALVPEPEQNSEETSGMAAGKIPEPTETSYPQANEQA